MSYDAGDCLRLCDMGIFVIRVLQVEFYCSVVVIDIKILLKVQMQ